MLLSSAPGPSPPPRSPSSALSPRLGPTSISSASAKSYFAQVSGEIRKLNVVRGRGGPLKDGFVELLEAECEVEGLVVEVLNFEQKDADKFFNGEVLVRLDVVCHFEDGVAVEVVEEEVEVVLGEQAPVLLRVGQDVAHDQVGTVLLVHLRFLISNYNYRTVLLPTSLEIWINFYKWWLLADPERATRFPYALLPLLPPRHLRHISLLQKAT